MRKRSRAGAALLPVMATAALLTGIAGPLRSDPVDADLLPPSVQSGAPTRGGDPYYRSLALAADERARLKVVYDPSYVTIPYPGGDVPGDRGVCTDVVVRSYRAVGDDLQVQVHEDMKAHFSEYPPLWGLTRPDRNIDHRRVPNLMAFFRRHGTALPLSEHPGDYSPGDIVAWDLGGGVTHIGIVSTVRSMLRGRHLVVHNIGAGTVLEDCLFDWKVIGHYRYGAESEQRHDPAALPD